MSQRSVVEFNHDYSHEIDRAPSGQVEKLLVQALASGSDESWEPLRRFGITRVVQLHHSDDRKVVANLGRSGVVQEYPFG